MRVPIALAALSIVWSSMATAQPEVRRHSPSDPPGQGQITVPDALPSPPEAGPETTEPAIPQTTPQADPDPIPPPLQLSPFEVTAEERCEGFPQFTCALGYRCANVETTTADTRYECVGSEGAQIPTVGCSGGATPAPTGRGYMCVVPSG